jgi:hypothetical protein
VHTQSTERFPLVLLGLALGKPARIGEDHVWFEDRWMVASLCDE